MAVDRMREAFEACYARVPTITPTKETAWFCYSAASKEREELLEALKAIVALETRPFEYPADWSEQIAACPDCQRFKDHPLFNGICDTHRKPMYGRERHDEQELRSIGWRAKDIARAAIAKEQGAKK